MKEEIQMSESQGRRDFFKKLVLASMAVNLPMAMLSCKDEDVFVGSGKTPYKIWEEMLYYLKTSPDHLKSRMESLIKEGDPERMYDFVKNEIQLIPLSEKSIGDVGKGLKWGPDYALRSGMATPREKAELLTTMFQEAKITSRVIFENHTVSPKEAQSYFFRKIDRICAPDIPKRVLKNWAKELDVSLEIETKGLSAQAGMKKAEDLGTRVLKSLNLPEDHYFRPFDFRWNGYETPIVEFEIDGLIKYANLFDPKVSFGNLKSNDVKNVKEVKPAKQNQEKVSVTLNYRDSIEPLKEKELINGQWLASDLVGRQLGVSFLNNLSIEKQSYTKVGNVHVFTPALTLQAMDASEEFMAERSVIADPITLSGKRIELDGDTVKIGGVSLLSKPNSELQKKVKNLDIAVTTAQYPSVKLSISPKDKNNALIEGLSASDFRIIEDGLPVFATMEANQRTPRILIMADSSLSMPKAFHGEGMETLISSLEAYILEIYPAAIISYWKTPSSLFTWLLKASQTDNDLIIFATDGDNNDKLKPADEAIYRSGPPAIILDVKSSSYGPNIKTFNTMATLTNGIYIPVKNHETALNGIKEYLDKMVVDPYVFNYYSVGDTEDRMVTVSVDEHRCVAKTTYAFDTIESGSQIGPKIIGLYLSVKYANNREVKRVLSGWDYSVNPREIPSQAMADEVNDLMLGGMQLYFEGAGPTHAVALSDLLTAKLSTRTWGEALLDNDIASAKTSFEKGQFNLSGDAMSLMLPLSNCATQESLTVPGGLRIGLQTIKPGVITGLTSSLFDYFPTSNYVTLSADPKKGFQTTVIKTAELAIREHQLYPISTYSELLETSWINLKKARDTQWLRETPEIANSNYWYERVFRGASLRIFDSSGRSEAFWNVDASGELYGMLPNGSGGGGDRFKAQLEEINLVVNAYTSMLGIAGVGGPAVGIVALYGLTLVKLYAIASEAIVVMDTTGMDEAIAKALKGLACNVQKSIMFMAAGPAGGVMAGLDNLISLMGGKSPFGCN